jgi:hypothetical protein
MKKYYSYPWQIENGTILTALQLRYLKSVSRFQEKEKRGEMITKNDNIKW